MGAQHQSVKTEPGMIFQWSSIHSQTQPFALPSQVQTPHRQPSPTLFTHLMLRTGTLQKVFVCLRLQIRLMMETLQSQLRQPSITAPLMMRNTKPWQPKLSLESRSQILIRPPIQSLNQVVIRQSAKLAPQIPLKLYSRQSQQEMLFST